MIAIEKFRNNLKCYIWKMMNYCDQEEERMSDQNKGVAMPPMQKPLPDDSELIQLPPAKTLECASDISVREAIAKRKSWRKFRDEDLTLEELSFLLYCTQGVRDPDNELSESMRTVPSAGARHAFETYLYIRRVKGLKPGMYRYQPLDHGLVYGYNSVELPAKISEACYDQKFCADSAVTFIWAAVPYRMEWRYGKLCQELILLDAGHVCQNLYLACEAVGCGTCAIAAYNQEKLDQLIMVDGDEEIAVYAAPVGKV